VINDHYVVEKPLLKYGWFSILEGYYTLIKFRPEKSVEAILATVDVGANYTSM